MKSQGTILRLTIIPNIYRTSADDIAELGAVEQETSLRKHRDVRLCENAYVSV